MHLKILLDFFLICHIERMDHGFMLDLIGDDCKNDGGRCFFSTSTWECFVIEIFMVGALYNTISQPHITNWVCFVCPPTNIDIICYQI